MQTIKTILEFSSVWIIVLPLIIGLWCIKKLHSNSIIVFILVVVAAVPQLLPPSTFYTPLFFISYNIYTLLEFVLLFLLFHKNFTSKPIKNTSTVTAVVYIFFAAYYVTFFSFSKEFINQLACINNLFYVLLIIFYVLEIKLNETVSQTSINSYHYYLVGILQYAACSTLILSLYHFKNNSLFLNTLWIFQSIPNIAMYVLFSIGFMIDFKNYKHITT